MKGEKKETRRKKKKGRVAARHGVKLMDQEERSSDSKGNNRAQVLLVFSFPSFILLEAIPISFVFDVATAASSFYFLLTFSRARFLMRKKELN